MTPPSLVVISYYDRRSTDRLNTLLASFARYEAGAPYDVVVVVNRTSDTPLSLPTGVQVLERENLGMNIGAWDHGWRTLDTYENYLFLQDECYVVRDGWLSAFIERAQDPALGLIGESLNPSWDAPWETLRVRHHAALPDHTIDGRPAPRVDAYLDFMRRRDIDPGPSGRHMRSLVWFGRRDALERIDGFPIGANYGECIAAEIGVGRKIEALGMRVAQVSPEEFRFIRHLEYNRDHPAAPFTHKRVTRSLPRSPRAVADHGAALEKPASGAVIFRVHSASPMLASTRYRALLPALGLEALGVRTFVTEKPISAAALSACHAIVFAKAFRPADMELAFEAHAASAPIVLDICDDMFIPNYGDGKGALYTATFQAMARIASAIVTTGPALAERIEAISPGAPITIIPDQIETPDSVARVLKRPDAKTDPVTWRARAEFALRNPQAALERVRVRLAPAPTSAAREQLSVQAPTKHRTIIWFGNHGAAHSAFGMGALEPLLPHIATAAKTHAVKMLIVSNSREKFEKLFSDVPYPAEYREWSPTRIFADLDEADICLIPIPREQFALAKSANRVALALSRGVAVIADDFPALADFSGAVVSGGDWAGGLELYLGDEARRQADIARGQAIIARSFSAQAVARRWADLLETLPKKSA